MDNKESVNGFLDKFKRLNKNAKMVILGGTAVCIIAVSVGFIYTGQEEKSVLFSNLTATDASEVCAKLDELRTDYSIKENRDGTINIMVNEEDTATARMEVSSTFTPSDGNVVGYEILDSTSFGETQSDRDAKRIRALEGEITKTLQKIPAIESARVHINVAENSFLSTSEEKSTASVTLQLAENASLSKNQTIGIIKIVSNSVSGLEPQNVEVIDTNANLLSKGLFNEDDYTDSDETLKLAKEKEANIASKITNVLNPVVGAGNAVVSVDLDLNMDKKEIASQILGDKAPVSEKEIVKNTTVNNNNGNIVGTDPNSDTDDYVANEANTNETSSESYTETQTNYEFSTTNEKTVVAQGSINKMTVSVVLDKTALLDENGNVNEELKSELLENIKTASGFDEERNDQVSLTVAAFNKKAEEENLEMIKSENNKNILSSIVTGVVALTIVGGIILLAKKSLDSLKEIKVKSNQTTQPISPMKISADSINGINDTAILEERVKKTIETNPDDAIKAVRYLINSDDSKNN